MSPTRNRNFVRRVPDKSGGREHPSHRRRVRGGVRGGAANEARRNLLFRRARRRGEITRCHTLLVARLLSGPREESRPGSSAAAASGPREEEWGTTGTRSLAGTQSDTKRIPPAFAQLSLSVDSRFCAHRARG